MQRVSALSIFGLLFAAALYAADPKTEDSFRDPITTKSGKYTVQFPSPGARAKSLGVLAFFHGSGNSSGYASQFGTLQTLGKEYDLIPLAIQAPNNAITWPDDATGPSNQHVAYAKSLLERVIYTGHPEIDPDRSFFVGFSAGSTFLSGDFLPALFDHYRGGAVMLCGGGGPVGRAASSIAPLPPAVAKAFPLYFYIQKGDFHRAAKRRSKSSRDI